MRRPLLVLFCCRGQWCSGQRTGRGASGTTKGARLLYWNGGLLVSVCGRCKEPAWVLFMCWQYPLGGKRMNMNAAFEQVGRPLEAVKITVLLKMQCCVGFLEVKWQSSLLVCYVDLLVGL